MHVALLCVCVCFVVGSSSDSCCLSIYQYTFYFVVASGKPAAGMCQIEQ